MLANFLQLLQFAVADLRPCDLPEAEEDSSSSGMSGFTQENEEPGRRPSGSPNIIAVISSHRLKVRWWFKKRRS